jgi:excinuclease UvrABC helicase subunit UvrB
MWKIVGEHAVISLSECAICTATLTPRPCVMTRVEILRDLRLGAFDVLVGIN